MDSKNPLRTNFKKYTKAALEAAPVPVPDQKGIRCPAPSRSMRCGAVTSITLAAGWVWHSEHWGTTGRQVRFDTQWPRQNNMLLFRKRSTENSDKRIEILTAILRAPDRRETCLLYAVRADVAGSSASPAYHDLRIRDLPRNLGDGDYPLEVNGSTLTLQIRGAERQIVPGEILSQR